MPGLAPWPTPSPRLWVWNIDFDPQTSSFGASASEPANHRSGHGIFYLCFFGKSISDTVGCEKIQMHSITNLTIPTIATVTRAM